MDEELQRYIEYLQRSLLSPGSELAHDTAAFRQWVANNRARLESIAQLSGGTAETVDELERKLAQYAPRSVFDSFTATAIFGHILERVLDAAREANLAPHRPILFANSTDVSASAAARPSSGEHLLFAGVGTYAFCNYWAKIVARIASAFHAKFGGSTITADRLREVFSTDPRLAIDAVKLALRCKLIGSAVGHGEMEGSAATAPFRLELLRAMETFVIGHEVGHCYFEERRASQESASVAEEFACDLYALAVSRTVGNRHHSWIAFNGAGAYVFLRVAAICTPIPEGARSASESTHPASKERAEAVRETSIANMAADQRDGVMAYLGDLEAMCNEIESLVSAVVSNGLR